MMMAQPLSRTFKSLKPNSNLALNPILSITEATTKKLSKCKNQSQDIPLSSSSSNDGEPSSPNSVSISKSSSKNHWAVYLIISTNPPIKTYVGVTNDFSRRLKQHNGELKGGAKASRSGRPWICACLVRGFGNKSKACEFESKWKILSKRLPRKRSSHCNNEKQADDSQLLLLQHRQAALDQVKDLIDCNTLEIDWQLSPV